MKLAASATVGAVAAAGSSAASEYETITIPAGEQRVFRVESGETFENVLFDQTAKGANALLVAHGTDWTVQNVGWKGPASGSPGRAFVCSDRGGGHSVARNLYLGDGVDRLNDRHPGLGIWVAPQHSGHIDFEHVYIEGARDNGIYASAPGSNSNGERGTVRMYRCFGKNNRVAHFRLAGGTVEECVAVNTGDGPAGRNLWVWPGKDGLDVEVRDCDFVCGTYAHGYDFGQSGQTTNATVVDTDYAPASSTRFKGTVNLDERNVGHDPEVYVPDGCPTTPEEAASGGSRSEPEGTPVRIEGETEYRIEVSDSIEPYPAFARYVERGEAYGDDWAEWFVTDWTEWYFTGELEALELSDPEGVTVLVDGEAVDPADFDGKTPSRRTLRIEGETEYYVEVSDSIEPYPDFAQYVEEGESYGDDWADWFVTNWTEWRFTGELEALELSDPAGVTVLVDGEAVDPADFGTESLEHLVLIEGTDEDVSRFEFVVDGRVERANADGAIVDDETEIEDGFVHGVVGDWTEAFRFDGDLEELTVDGPATVRLDGEAIDPSDYGEEFPHVLEVEATDLPASFEITVDGTIEYDGDETADDVSVVSGTTVESSIAEGAQRFRFSGALTDVTFTDGIAALRLDGEAIDPEAYGDQILFPHALVIDGTDAEGSSTYSFAIDGRVIKSDYRRASIDADDTIEGASVSGNVANWLDAYWFDGNIEDFTLAGDARVHLEYNARDQ